ncbi:NADH-quinone oxidoreductase subunit N [Larkinella humicola]|uniref:NADH-quinone oxidoreductase subunit N n=1 Tax=Larkinella humicola TaxID=2607654 RepID=A0A5N1JJE0_9BACT|nr:NADH-quinone oxidoreductase subunit N [Larkinella humicola]KAA9353473.1 NADH-quinone oxidoreductase subunit N [Larkinella humicola]
MQLIDQLNDSIRSLSGFWPELALVFAIAILVVTDLVLLTRSKRPSSGPASGQLSAQAYTRSKNRSVLYGLSLTAVTVAGALVVEQGSQQKGFLFNSVLLLDNQAVFYKLVVTLAAFFAILHAWTVVKTPNSLPFDWLPILLALLLGLYLMTMSVNLLTIYLSIELVSISSYLLTGLSASRKASEGSLKYLLFGAVSSAIMLYGMSLLYGLTGTLALSESVEQLAQNDSFVIYVAGFLTLGGILFKLSLVPFHVWTPDVYEAAPTPVVAFFSVAPKAAALLVLMRVLTALPANFQTPMAVIALASITLGNLSALWQTNAKRLLAYSSIAHAGFLLVGVVAFNETGFEAATFYVATYVFINLAAFLLIDLLEQSHNGNLTIQDFSGLGTSQPLLSAALTAVMIALTGLPPTVGFTAKFLAFSALLEAYQTSANPWVLALFAIGLLNAVISLFYYLRIPFLMYFRPASTANLSDIHIRRPQLILATVLTVPVLVLFFKPDWILRWIGGL